MSKISEVCYIRIPDDICSLEEASEFYFYQNAIGLDGSIDDDYEEYEMKQSDTRSRMFNEYMKENPNKRLVLNSTIYGTSSMSNSVILVADVR